MESNFQFSVQGGFSVNVFPLLFARLLHGDPKLYIYIYNWKKAIDVGLPQLHQTFQVPKMEESSTPI